MNVMRGHQVPTKGIRGEWQNTSSLWLYQGVFNQNVGT
jgi:hypothetical protein